MKTRLARFTATGYRNFGDPITIDFTDVHDYRFNQICVDDNIIMKMGIYGPNGSGKSNLGFALFNIVSHLTDNASEVLKSNPGIFLNVDKRTTEAVFHYEFKHGNDLIVFEYRKPNESSISRETFKLNDKIIYDYDYISHGFSVRNLDEIAGPNLTFEYMGDNLSVLRYIANNTVQKDDSPVRAVMDFASHMLWFRSLNNGNNYIGLENGSVLLDDWIINNGYVRDFNDFLKEICGIDVKLDVAKGIDNKPILIEKHKNGSLIFRIVLSSGTSAAELFYFWMKRFNNVSFLFLDEFDVFYHFELAGKIIKKLNDYPDMQVIFTTHNTTLMGNDILRPDCYLILKEGKLRSYIDRAGGREIREGHNLEKIYRGGGLNG